MQADKQIPDIQNVVADVLALAKQKGATQAEASMSKIQGIAVGTRMMDVETIEFNNDGGLGICVFVGKRKGTASTADLSKEALELTVEKAVQIAKHTSEDQYSGLADAELMVKTPRDLDLYYPQPLDTEQGIDLAKEAEERALSYDERVKQSDGCSFHANIGCRVYGNTHGVNVGYPSSRYSYSCVMIAEQANADNSKDMQRDYAYTVAREFKDLRSPALIGAEAAKNAVNRLGGRKLSTMSVPVLFHKEIATSLYGHLVSGISGGALYRNSSFLQDSLNTQILPDWFSILERPHLKKGLASSAFDSEGVETHDMDIVTNGVLNHYLLASYAARRLGMQTNGHAGGIHNWLVKDTGEDEAALLRKMNTGLYVTELMGQGVNSVTGDYSRGAAGFWVENGVIQYPVHEITIASNLKDMFKNIVAVGSEVDANSSIRSGAILIESMQIAGN